jgi:hypothetical protein
MLLAFHGAGSTASTADIMDSFAPELSLHWLRKADDANDGRGLAIERDTPSPTQQQALDALADRVNAARSIL